MYSGKLHILTTLAFMIICVTHGGAATYSPLSNTTYTVTFHTDPGDTQFRFYIDAGGRIFAYSNDGSTCGSTGSFTKLNASNRTQYSCYLGHEYGTMVVSSAAMARLSGSTITYEEHNVIRSTRTSPMLSTWRMVFSTDSARCEAISYQVDKHSLPAVSCEVSAGHP